MRSNLSVLERNICHGFEAYDCAEEVTSEFLAGIDRFGLIESERRANRWAKVGDRIAPMLELACRPYAERYGSGDYGVRDFIETRHRNLRHD